MRIYVESRGFDDPGGKYAGIKVNDTDYAQNKMAFNIVVVDGVTGTRRYPRPFQISNFPSEVFIDKCSLTKLVCFHVYKEKNW